MDPEQKDGVENETRDNGKPAKLGSKFAKRFRTSPEKCHFVSVELSRKILVRSSTRLESTSARIEFNVQRWKIMKKIFYCIACTILRTVVISAKVSL